MADLTTNYMGLTLHNPIIIGSSGLTSSLNEIHELEKNGAGAIVLKSLFEEQIMLETQHKLEEAAKNDFIYDAYSETLDYIDVHIRDKQLSGYLEHIREIKASVMIPVIASINCITSHEWTYFAHRIEEAGADALELNVFVMPFNFNDPCDRNMKTTVDILQKVKRKVHIPVAVKISPYFSNLGNVLIQLAGAGADAMVLFNRFAGPDIDIEKLEVSVANRFSAPSDLTNTLRWIAVASSRIKTPLAASTGVHHWQDVVKLLLTGAQVTQITSAVYLNGPEIIHQILDNIHHWMDKKGFNYIDQFRGKLSQNKTDNPEVYERLQFMKYFSEIR
ncbi:MAG: dihydroorotate dehydrogenase-like protein [Chlorobi bacterium]|nr:dihydroorotate dehydrogenase-like protein [Chlorobiota bacterium]